MARPSGRLAVIAGLLVAVCLIGGFLIWKRRGPGGAFDGDRAGGARGPSLYASDLEVERNQPAGTIAGVVLDADGRPLDGASVILVRVPARDAPWSANNGRPLQVVRSAGGGAFAFADVAPGAYGVSAMAARQAPGHRSPVKVASNETTRVELKLARGGFVLRGRVLDMSGGTVPGAKVGAREFAMTSGETGSAPRVLQTTADQNGNYELHLGRGQYGLAAEADGYAPANDWFMMTADATRDLRLSPASGIGGRVVERGTGKPVADADLWVAVHRAGMGGSRPRDVKTDEDGRFWFNDLEPGSYRVGARKGRLVGMSQTVSVALAQRVDDVQVEVHPGVVVAGRTVDKDGKPVAGVRVDLWKSEPPMDRPLLDKTGADGAFRIEGVLPAAYRLSTRSDGFGPVRQELQVAADMTNVRLELPAEATVSGKVLGADGRPIEGALVSVMVRARSSGSFERAQSGVDGSFQVKGLSAGDLSVTATHDTGVANVKDQKLADAEAKTVSLRLAPGGSISGTIKLDDGKPAAGARIQAMPGDGGSAGRWNETAGPDGSYKLKGLTAGRIIVVAATHANMRWGGPDRPDHKNITLADGENKTGVDLVVAGAKSISGTVVDPGGKPIAGAEVTAGVEEGPEGRAFRGRGFAGGGAGVHPGRRQLHPRGCGRRQTHGLGGAGRLRRRRGEGCRGRRHGGEVAVSARGHHRRPGDRSAGAPGERLHHQPRTRSEGGRERP